jgi:tetratricopeptide (TPR) repeat protein
MTTTLKRQAAQRFYDDGAASFRNEKYEQALVELKQAEDAFRELDAAGHPFGYSLANGVSGLANTYALKGRCQQKLGKIKQAVANYESCLINAKFENKRSFHRFWSELSGDLTSCYEMELGKIPTSIEGLIQDPEIDIAFLFPYSLPQELISVARLYELVPQRYPQFSAFYASTKKKDLYIRRMDKRSDESTMNKLSVYVWGTLVSIWVTYGWMVLHALFQKK